jgi:transcriptional regulator with XRE-family HTH domain
MAKKPTLSSVIRSARLERGLTLKAVADAVGVTGPAISHWEAALNKPSDKNLTAICKVLRLPVRATRELAGD